MMETILSKRSVPPVRPLPEFVPSSRKRADFVQDIFDHTAHHYDALSAALSFGTCRAYRRFALRRAGLTPGMKLLDVATGTGLVARAAMQIGIPCDDIIGLDLSRGMLNQNHKRHSIPLVQGFGEALPFEDESFDFITLGYALRHADDLVELFTEFRRVLRRNGRVLILEISRPASRLGVGVGRFYFCSVLANLTRVFTRNADTPKLLRFYWKTIEECVPPPVILEALEASGLREAKRHTMGSLLNDYMACRAE
ncbi:MAG: class I SAM-dependent methyltransferase [Verrucomicrobia subdivision 3 bacterium]|nr:class I SAM-dependent methyltransferase [Limisphaerales bacterium]